MKTNTRRRGLPADDGVTPTEAAWLSELPAKAVNATIDKGELPLVGARRLGPAAVLYLMLRRSAGNALSREARREVYEKLQNSTIAESWSAFATTRPADLEIRLGDGTVKVDLKQACARLAKRLKALREAQESVVSDPAIRGGEPVISGTRIPVYAVAEQVGKGAQVRELLADYPALNATRIRVAVAYASTHPRRGRPPAAPWKSRALKSSEGKEGAK